MRTFVSGMVFMSVLSAALLWVMTVAGFQPAPGAGLHAEVDVGEAKSLARFEPSSPAVVSTMIRMAEVTHDDVVYDLGCGDGRVVIAAAREHGARGIGVDIDPGLIGESRENAGNAGVSHLVQFFQEDLVTTDISSATVVMLYLSPDANIMLRPKLLKELKPGTRIVSHCHDMGEWLPDREADVEGHRVYLWVVPSEVSGRWKLVITGKGAADGAWIEFSQMFQNATARLGYGQTAVPVTVKPLKGGILEFSIEGDWGPVPAGTRFSGIVEKNRMSGKYGSGTRSGSWSAERIR